MAQTAEAVTVLDPTAHSRVITAPAAGAAGQVLQLADGKAGVVIGADASSDAYASGDLVTVQVGGVYSFLKTASICLLKGGKAYWDRSANKVHFRPQSGDFFIGTIAKDALAADATVEVDLNVVPEYAIELGKGQWTNGATDGLGVTLVAEGSPLLKLAFDAVAEVGMAALYSVDTVPVADGPIFEGKVAIYDIGDDAALDINFGLANGTHATDADAITESVFIHLDGTALDINVESDDGSTEVNATDSTIDAVDDTYFEVWIDCRDLSDVKVYVDGVDAGALASETLVLSAATGPLLPIAHIEKTNNDTTADVRVEFMRVRSTDEG